MDFSFFGTSFSLAPAEQGQKILYSYSKAPTHRRGVPIPAHIPIFCDPATLSAFPGQGLPDAWERRGCLGSAARMVPRPGLTAKNSFIDLYHNPTIFNTVL